MHWGTVHLTTSVIKYSNVLINIYKNKLCLDVDIPTPEAKVKQSAIELAWTKIIYKNVRNSSLNWEESIHLYMVEAKGALHILQNDTVAQPQYYNEKMNENDRMCDKIIKQWIWNKWKKWRITPSSLVSVPFFAPPFSAAAAVAALDFACARAIAAWHWIRVILKLGQMRCACTTLLTLIKYAYNVICMIQFGVYIYIYIRLKAVWTWCGTHWCITNEFVDHRHTEIDDDGDDGYKEACQRYEI